MADKSLSEDAGPEARPVEFRRETVVAVDIVTEALAVAHRGTGEIHFKIGRDVVTDTDVAIEDFIRAKVDNDLGHDVVGEERGGQAPSAEAYWLVDPICGTRNFASGLRLFAVNMALVEQRDITVAVVGDGSTGAVHVAEMGVGAWTLGPAGPRRLRAVADSRIVVLDAWPPFGAERDSAAHFAAASIRADRWDIRSLATTLTLAYVAEGRVAANVSFSTQALHCAPGALLASEAGAVVTDLEGRAWTIDSASLVASASDELHHDLLDLHHASQAHR